MEADVLVAVGSPVVASPPSIETAGRCFCAVLKEGNGSTGQVVMVATLLGGYMGFVCFVFLLTVARPALARVVLIGKDVSLTFNDIEASFAPPIRGSGICGTLHVAKPRDACSPLNNSIARDGETNASFVLIMRGNCTFDEKVKRAQSAGFKAVIVYDNEDGGILVAMSGNPHGIKIPAVFVSKASGEVLKKYVNNPDIELWIIPTFVNSAWSILAISFISLLAISAVLGTCFFVRRHSIRRERPQDQNVREFHGMGSHLVRAMPSLVFTTASEDNCTSMTCSICLEDYSVGDKLRVLPCCHKFHAACVDLWLTSWRTFCPVCKRDARTISGNPPASECTPLLSSAASIPVSSSVFSSFHSSLAASSAIQIGSPSQSHSISRIHSVSSAAHAHHSLRSHAYSPGLSASRNTFDFRDASSLRSHTSFLASPHSLGYSSAVSPLNSRQPSMYIPSSSHASPSYMGSSSRRTFLRQCSELAGSESSHASPSYMGSSSRRTFLRQCSELAGSESSHASPSYMGSSSRQTFLRHCSESAGSISPFASAQSLPGC